MLNKFQQPRDRSRVRSRQVLVITEKTPHRLGLKSTETTTNFTKMCQYYYAYYDCGCDITIWLDEAETCANRYLDGYGGDYFFPLMCPNAVIVCDGNSGYVCDECSEDWDLEFELDEDELL